MKKLFGVIMIAMLLILGNGCSAQENKGSVPAPSIESQLSEAHREFQEKKNFGQIAFYICGGIVIAGVLFKVGAIITAFISGKRLAERRRKEKEEKVRKAWQKEMSSLETEKQRYKEYMEKKKQKELEKPPEP